MNAIIVYFSLTGNTEGMALKLKSDLDCDLVSVDNASLEDTLNHDTIILGCPAMGVEELDTDTFYPFYLELMKNLKGNRIFLFGSYGWGGGEFMRTWEEETKKYTNLESNGLDFLGDPNDCNPSDYEKFVNQIKSK